MLYTVMNIIGYDIEFIFLICLILDSPDEIENACKKEKGEQIISEGNLGVRNFRVRKPS